MAMIRYAILVAVVQVVVATTGDCNFENGTCNWLNAINGDDFDWTITHGSTPSAQTGPDSDHNGNVTAKYLYIETSAPRRTGDIARLESSVSYSGVYCFVFWYHMYGSTIRSLNIYTQSTAVGKQREWSLQGNQGSIWHKAELDFNSTSGNYKILIEGVRGSSYTGDIAVDDFLLRKGQCASHMTTTEMVSTTRITTTKGYTPGNNCTFEHGGLFAWRNSARVGDDDFDWIIGSGSTPTSGTGPSMDHYGSSTGKYLFIETSSPRTSGDKAKLYSSLISACAGATCFTFWYHMYGSDIGQLNILVESNYTAGGTGQPQPQQLLRWRLTGNQGNTWHRAAIAVGTAGSSAANYMVVMEGVRGKDYMGDIAIDDLQFNIGFCTTVPAQAHQPVPTTLAASSSPLTTTKIATTVRRQPDIRGNCSFQNGLCDWVNIHTGDQFDWTIRRGHTPSIHTGPISDHSGNVTAKYLYIETSSPRRLGDVARLESTISYNGVYCFVYWYHMYGSTIGSLNIYTQNRTAGRERQWSLQGNQGNRWHKAEIDVNGTSGDYKVIIEGVCGNGSNGDIAVDDFMLRKGHCSTLHNVSTTQRIAANMTTTSLWHMTNSSTTNITRRTQWPATSSPKNDTTSTTPKSTTMSPMTNVTGSTQRSTKTSQKTNRTSTTPRFMSMSSTTNMTNSTQLPATSSPTTNITSTTPRFSTISLARNMTNTNPRPAATSSSKNITSTIRWSSKTSPTTNITRKTQKSTKMLLTANMTTEQSAAMSGTTKMTSTTLKSTTMSQTANMTSTTARSRAMSPVANRTSTARWSTAMMPSTNMTSKTKGSTTASPTTNLTSTTSMATTMSQAENTSSTMSRSTAMYPTSEMKDTTLRSATTTQTKNMTSTTARSTAMSPIANRTSTTRRSTTTPPMKNMTGTTRRSTTMPPVTNMTTTSRSTTVLDPILSGECVKISNKTGIYFRTSWKLPANIKMEARSMYANVTIKSGKSFKTFRITSMKNRKFFDYKSDVSFMVGIRLCSKICSDEVDIACKIITKSGSQNVEDTAPVLAASIGGVVAFLAIVSGVSVIIKKGACARLHRVSPTMDEKGVRRPLDLTSGESSIPMGNEGQVNAISDV